jgi:hypothetical protein
MTPDVVLDFLLGQLVVCTRHLPRSKRMALAEKMRDAADAIEHQDG